MTLNPYFQSSPRTKNKKKAGPFDPASTYENIHSKMNNLFINCIQAEKVSYFNNSLKKT